ncbi:MAG: diguanylate cyclase [Steroidobacteraceae bacterium]
MDRAGHTTVIRKFLEQQGPQDSSDPFGGSGTIAIMLRVLPPPRLLLCIEQSDLRDALANRLALAMIDVETTGDDDSAARSFEREPCHILVTDNIELVRKIRARQTERAPVVLYVLGRGEGGERVAAMRSGADDCLDRRIGDEELAARIGLARRIAELHTVLRATMAENRKLGAFDELTGLSSRRFFSQHFPREVERAARYARPLGLVLCDIDHFKAVNDKHGHAAGDEVLRQLGSRMRKCLRSGVDWIARLGGEEFAVVLPETTHDDALTVARKLRSAVGDSAFIIGAKQVPITACFGLCSIDMAVAAQTTSSDALLKAADAALFRSKSVGTNRVTAAAIGRSARPPPAG